jgi:hypothetical protein
MNELLERVESSSREKEGLVQKAALFNDLLDMDDFIMPYLTEGGFFSDPASCRYHGSWKGGLAQHSLRVLFHALRLKAALSPETNEASLIRGALLHDICKMGGYEISTRNVKKDGSWISEPFYMNKNRADMGHGAESVWRLRNLGVSLAPGWWAAVRWHMGNFDVSPTDGYCLMEAQKQYPEVLLLQTADVLAGIVENI